MTAPEVHTDTFVGGLFRYRLGWLRRAPVCLQREYKSGLCLGRYEAYKDVGHA